MEISKSTQEVLAQAQEFRIETSSGEELCQEHVYYALLLWAGYLDGPWDDPEFRKEAERLRMFLSKNLNSVGAAREYLKETAQKDHSGFTAADKMLGRAIEIAGRKAVSPMDLARAIFEGPGDVIMAANAAVNLSLAPEDAKYAADLQKKQEAAEKRREAARLRREEEKKRKEDEDRLRREEDDIRREEEAEKKRREEEIRQQNEKVRQKIEEEQQERERKEQQAREEKLRARLQEEEKKRKEAEEQKRRLALARQIEQEEIDHIKKVGVFSAFREYDRRNKPKQEKPKWTYIGPFEFKGAPFWGYLQYFLWGLLISCGALLALEHFTHYVSAPPTRFWGFAIDVFIVLSVYYHLRGITYLMETKWPAWALFTRQLFDLVLIAGLMSAYVFEFAAPARFPRWLKYFSGEFLTFKASPLRFVPRWLKYVGGVFGVLVFSVGTILYNGLHYGPAERKKSIRYGNNVGPVGKVIFQAISGYLAFPLAILVGIWAYNKPFKLWHIKVFWLYGFVTVWGLFFIIITCKNMAAQSGWYRGKMGAFWKFLFSVYIFFFFPLLVLYLHWLFGWLPVKTWVWIVLGIYSFIVLVGSFIGSRE